MTSFEKFLLLYDICLPPMLTGVWDGPYALKHGVYIYLDLLWNEPQLKEMLGL